MASRPSITPFHVLTNADMSVVGRTVSKVSIVQDIPIISYDLDWAGSAPNGTVTVEASNTYVQSAGGAVKTPGNWNTIPLSAAAVVSGNTGVGAIHIENVGFYAIRLVYTAVSGTGALNATVCGKVY